MAEENKGLEEMAKKIEGYLKLNIPQERQTRLRLSVLRWVSAV